MPRVPHACGLCVLNYSNTQEGAMNKTNKNYKIYRMLALAFVVFLSLGLTISAMAYTWPEPPDATPGSPVTINGDNRDGATYQVGENVHVVAVNNDTGWTGTCDATVNDVDATHAFPFWACVITLSSNPAEAVGAYTYTTLGLTSGETEQGAFTDWDRDFKQCANGKITGVVGNCDWINSILQQSNSTYYEGMGVPQRAIFTGIAPTAGNTHTLTFKHQATKGGGSNSHAYDWLVSYDQAIALASAALNNASGGGGAAMASLRQGRRRETHQGGAGGAAQVW